MLSKLFGSAQTPRASKPVVEMLEKRELMDAVANEAKIKVRNVSANGISTNESVITIPFSEPITLVDADKIRIRGYALNPISGGQRKLVIRITDAVQIDDYHIALTTDRLMRKGGRIYFDPGSIVHQADSSNIPEQIVRSPKGQNKERFTLASRAFVPTNETLFNSDIYQDNVTPVTVLDDALDSATVRASLQTFMNNKVTKGYITSAEATAAMAQFDDATMQARIPDANLRAGLISLTGTFAESAIQTFTTGDNLSGKAYTILAFAEPRPFAPYADTQLTDTGRLRIRVRPELQGEPFTALSAILAHEAMHQDETSSIQEELIANLMEAVVYAQQIDVNPSTVHANTALVRDENTKLYALLNSGRTLFPIVGPLSGPILRSDTAGVFYSSTPIGAGDGGNYQSFDDYIRRVYEARGGTNGNTPGNSALSNYVAAFTGAAYGGTFSDALVTTLDGTLYPVLTNKLAVRAAGVLRMSVL